MKKFLLRSTAIVAIAVPAAAHAQSTGSIDFEEEIIVTGTLATDVGGVDLPDTPKAKQVLTEEIIRRQRPGQTVNDIINLVPGVSFQNNDPWGSSGGGFTIRGFTSDRISQTLDGLPLNDSGNYALYTNQQVDPEVLEQVNVNLGVTDVDSPTASAVGGTVNIRTRVPSMTAGMTSTLSYGNVLSDGSGDRPYVRAFGMLDTGDLTGNGLAAFVSGSITKYDNPFNNYGKVDKQQYNARIYQELGDNGDFVSVAAHYNQNRNNFFGSFAPYDFPTTKEDRFYEINYPCFIPDGVSGVADSETGDCGTQFDRRYNPSNTGNIRGSSRFSLSDSLTLTFDPSYQWVKANGGGDEELMEGFYTVGGVDYTGFFDSAGGRQYYYGRDLNGDGDMLDEVNGNDPSQTRTRRYGAIANLIYEINPDNQVRLAYTLDHAEHRQTGQTSVMLPTGEIADVFPINDPLYTADGFALNKRNRKSYAILHQVSGEYQGRFGPLTANLGLRAPFFTRKLDQRCYTESADGDLACFENQDPSAYEAAFPYAVDYTTGEVTGSALPQKRKYTYDKLLPNIGFTFEATDSVSIFANYAKGLSVPGTDVLYESLYFPADLEGAQPEPETTDSFDLGLRFQQGRFTAQLAGWYTQYNNRLRVSYNDLLGESVTTNLGRVDKYGIDGSVAFQPTSNTLLYVFGSWMDSEIKDDVQNGVDGDGNPVYLPTAGKRESGSPTYMLGARGQIAFGPVELGAQVKRTGKRYLNDLNLPLVAFGSEAYASAFDAYTLVDLDVRWNVGQIGNKGTVAVQANVTNLFDELYVGNFSGTLDNVWSFGQFVQIGAPRAASMSLIIGY